MYSSSLPGTHEHVFNYEPEHRPLYQPFEHYQVATIIILILKVKKTQTQKSYLIFPATQLVHVGVSV